MQSYDERSNTFLLDERGAFMPTMDPITLANELHDGVIQELSALLLQLETYERRLEKDPEAAEADLQRIKDQTRASLNVLRKLVTRLREMEETSSL